MRTERPGPVSKIVAAVGTAATLRGFLLVIIAAVIVIIKGRVVYAQLNDELRDIPRLAEPDPR
jgi:ABC-type phosphonate transport system ATPase subunit